MPAGRKGKKLLIGGMKMEIYKISKLLGRQVELENASASLVKRLEAGGLVYETPGESVGGDVLSAVEF